MMKTKRVSQIYDLMSGAHIVIRRNLTPGMWVPPGVSHARNISSASPVDAAPHPAPC